MPLQHEGPAPYTAASAVKLVIERARNGTLPSPVDAGVLERIGIQESLGPRTLASLKLLDLLNDDGSPSPTLDRIRTVKTKDFQPTLAAWLHDVYAEVFSLVPDFASATYGNIEDAFRGYTPAGQRGRMVTLFMALCQHAGLFPEGSSLDGAAKQPRLSVQSRRTTRTVPASPRKEPAKKDQPDRRMTKGDMLDVLKDQGVRLDPMILGLVQRLPPVDSEWPEAKREAWLAAAQATFNVLYTLPDDDEAG